jgi:hypothetical protein
MNKKEFHYKSHDFFFCRLPRELGLRSDGIARSISLNNSEMEIMYIFVEIIQLCSDFLFAGSLYIFGN